MLAGRRLSDRILFALDLAVEQADLETAELLSQALERAMTRFGGLAAAERRDLPAEFAGTLERLDALRRQRQGGLGGVDG